MEWHWIDSLKILMGFFAALVYDGIKRWRRGKVTDADRFHLSNIEELVLQLKMEKNELRRDVEERDRIIEQKNREIDEFRSELIQMRSKIAILETKVKILERKV